MHAQENILRRSFDMEFKKYTPPKSRKAELLRRITDEDYAQSLIATGDGVKRGTLFRYLLTAAAMLVVAVGVVVKIYPCVFHIAVHHFRLQYQFIKLFVIITVSTHDLVCDL